MLESEGHPSPDTIYERVKQVIPAISLATVYKNIRTFLEAGLVREVTLHHGAIRLETNPRRSTTIWCASAAGLIVDVDGDAIEPVRLRRKPPAGYRILRYSVELQGLCPLALGKQPEIERKPGKS